MKPGSPITMLQAPGSGQVSTKCNPVAPSRSPTIPKVLLRGEEGPKRADRVRQMIRDLHYEVVEGEGQTLATESGVPPQLPRLAASEVPRSRPERSFARMAT